MSSIKEILEEHGMNKELEDLIEAVDPIIALYVAVASGQTKGGRGGFYADGKGTLCDLHVPIELIERLSKARGGPVLGRTTADRYPDGKEP